MSLIFHLARGLARYKNLLDQANVLDISKFCRTTQCFDICTRSVLILIIASECSRVADIVFVLDASESIYDQDFIAQMDFVVNITSQLNLNQTDGIMVGAVVYSSDIGDVVRLNDSKTQAEFETAVRSFVHLKDGTDTGLGIQRMRQLFMDGGRPGVSKVGIVITDGRSVDKEQTLLQSHYARLRNITMLAVGVGVEIDFQELQGIASGSNFLFQVQNYQTLGSLVLNFTTSLCPGQFMSLYFKCVDNTMILERCIFKKGKCE